MEGDDSDDTTAGAQPGPGRPTDYDPAFCEMAANWCAGGATDFEVAQKLNCHVATLYRWKAAHPEFRDALRVGKELADDRVESSLYHRAVGYSFSAVKILQNNGAPVIVPYIEHVPPGEASIKLWLTNRRRNQWQDKVVQENTGPNGGPQVNVTITTTDPIEAARAYAELIKGG